jgi:glycosyltransferase involved in cell wall biosynthesis
MQLKNAIQSFIDEHPELKRFEIENKLNISKTALLNILNDKKVGKNTLNKIYASGVLSEFDIDEFHELDVFNNLSVLMMVKNEEKNIERCLQSLQKIDKELLREIIIVDTGSTDSTINIIKKLQNTDEYPFNRIKLYFKEWNDDFSEIRNYTIKLSSGTWLFFIDADEELEEAKGINKLVREDNPEYHVGLIQIINYTKSDLTRYATMSSPRIFRAHKDFHYEGAVHNQPVFPTPFNRVKLLAQLKHYGYFNDDKKLQMKKYKRTTSILNKELEQQPNNHYYWYQLAQSNKMIGKHVEALKCIKTAIDLYDKHPNYYGVKASLELSLQKYDDVIQTTYNGIRILAEYIDYWYYLAEALRMKKEYQKAINSYNVFLSLTQNYDNLSISSATHIVVHTLGYVDDAMNKVVSLTATLALQAINT